MSTLKVADTNEADPLRLMRFIAALAVINFHFGREATKLSGALVAGPQMVTLFFVLSGFAIGNKYAGKTIRRQLFWTKRFIRIAPAYYISLIAFIAIITSKSKTPNQNEILLSASMLQSWIPPFPTSLNFPGWSISVDVFFYIIAPAMINMSTSGRIRDKTLLLLSLLLWGITQSLSTYALSSGNCGSQGDFCNDVVYYFPLTHACSFIMGFSASRFCEKISKINTTPNVTFAAALIITIAVLNNETEIDKISGMSFAHGGNLYAPLFTLLILANNSVRGLVARALCSKFCARLGNYSYLMYITQLPAHTLFSEHIASTESTLGFAAFVATLIALSAVMHHLFERPTSKFLTKWLATSPEKTQQNQYCDHHHT